MTALLEEGTLDVRNLGTAQILISNERSQLNTGFTQTSRQINPNETSSLKRHTVITKAIKSLRSPFADLRINQHQRATTHDWSKVVKSLTGLQAPHFEAASSHDEFWMHLRWDFRTMYMREVTSN